MKRHTIILMLIMSILSFSACSKNWPPIIVDKENVTFGPEGGTQVVSVIKNYPGCNLSSILDKNSGELFCTQGYPYKKIEGNGIKVIVDGASIIITVYPMTVLSDSHLWSITVFCGDAFKSIIVLQNNTK